MVCALNMHTSHLECDPMWMSLYCKENGNDAIRQYFWQTRAIYKMGISNLKLNDLVRIGLLWKWQNYKYPPQFIIYIGAKLSVLKKNSTLCPKEDDSFGSTKFYVALFCVLGEENKEREKE